MLRESQNFFYNLMSTPDVVVAFKKDRSRVLKRFFHNEKDRRAFSKIPFERFETYRKHISVGLLGGIEDAFPVLRSLVSEAEWNDLLNDFYLKRLTRSPIARRVFREFSHYLQKRYRGPLLKRLPYLRELAEYENVDLRLFYDVDRPVPALDVKDMGSVTDPALLLGLVPVLNPHHVLHAYRWPVHRICREFSSLKQVKLGRYPLLVYRDPDTLQIRFLEANPLVAEFVGRMRPGRSTIETLLGALIRRHRPADPQAFVAEAIGVLAFLKEKGVLFGFVKKTIPATRT